MNIVRDSVCPYAILPLYSADFRNTHLNCKNTFSKNIFKMLVWFPSISKLTWYRNVWCSEFDYKKNVHCELFLIILSNSRNLRWNLQKNVWKWPKIITNIKWFKTLFTSILYEIYPRFDFHQTYQIHALMLVLLLDSRISWWKSTNTSNAQIVFSTNWTFTKILYIDVVQVLRYLKPLVSFLYTFCLASSQVVLA